MSTFVDFAKVKDTVKVERAIGLLGLTMKQTGSQFRGTCPACRSGGDRALAINTDKQGYYCFAKGAGGDVIALAAHVRGMTQKEAAAWLLEQSGTPEPPAQATPQLPLGKSLAPLDYLTYTPAIKSLGLSEETCTEFGAGYAPKGIMRGRFAVPIKATDGTLLAYVGVAVTAEQSPKLHFPNGFSPDGVIFGADRVGEGELYLVRDPVQVLTSFEAGMSNVVCFLTETISAVQLEHLAALMDEKKLEHLEIY